MEAALAQVTDELKRVERTLRARRQALGADAAAGVPAPAGLGAQSAAMQRVLDLARRVAQVDTTVLITGESGVGKERVARLIHDESAAHRPGRSSPSTAAPCPRRCSNPSSSATPGARSPAPSQDRPGLFEAANNGTLLLDEIGEVPPAMQVKLLRVLQEREVRRVGENKGRAVNVRVLAATNRDLVEEIRAARFRQDLYYRLRVVELRVPPLRERRDDILPLARTFLAASAGAHRAQARRRSRRRRRSSCCATTGRATSASSRTRSSGRRCSPPRQRIEVEDLPDDVRADRRPPTPATRARSPRWSASTSWPCCRRRTATAPRPRPPSASAPPRSIAS